MEAWIAVCSHLQAEKRLSITRYVAETQQTQGIHVSIIYVSIKDESEKCGSMQMTYSSLS